MAKREGAFAAGETAVVVAYMCAPVRGLISVARRSGGVEGRAPALLWWAGVGRGRWWIVYDSIPRPRNHAMASRMASSIGPKR
jgi:hypothetical protein